MNEQMFFLPGSSEELFLHVHFAEKESDKVFVFLNPLLDEKKKVQQFQARTARRLCEAGCHVYRFDYFGTGDSKGELYEFSYTRIAADLECLLRYMLQKHSNPKVCVLGIRFGADLAITWAAQNPLINDLLLIEPLYLGSRFLLEQRTRRKVFHKIYGMQVADEVEIGGQRFEDFQGFVLSGEAVRAIGDIDSIEKDLQGKNILLYRLENVFSGKQFNSFFREHSARNNIVCSDVAVPGFWDKLETVDTTALTDHIVTALSPSSLC